MTYDDTSRIEFGQYRGKLLGDIPESYLLYLYDNHKGLDLGLKKYIKEKIEGNKPK